MHDHDHAQPDDDSILPDDPPSASASAPVPPATADGRYKIEKVLGKGGMGTVYQAQHLALKRTVALKVIRPDTMTDEVRSRFQAEAESVAQLDHPHIIKVFDYGDDLVLPGRPPSPYLALEYVPGPSLGAVLKEGVLRRPNGIWESAHLVAILARAIHHAHERGIIHRDLKPDNVLLAPPSDVPALNTVGGCPKITDFGLARRISIDQRLTQSGFSLGTPRYMSPEQVGGQKDAGPEADVWALGVILYECLTGQGPFRSESTPVLLYSIWVEEPKPVQELREDVPDELARVCMDCLNKEPSQRPTAKDLYARLARMLEGVAVETSQLDAVRPPLPRMDGTQPMPAVRQRRPSRGVVSTILAAVCILAVLALGGAMVYKAWFTEAPAVVPIPVADADPPQAVAEADPPKVKPVVEPKPPQVENKPVVIVAPPPEKEITNTIGLRLVLIPAGTFRMGAEDAAAPSGERPAHDVTIARPFYLGVYEVTQKEFKEVMGYNPSFFSRNGEGKEGINYANIPPAGTKVKVPDNTDDFPVENVSHQEAMEFCRRLSEREANHKREYRLPTEAEWEYAARAGTKSKYHFGDQISQDQANYLGRLLRTTKVGSYGANGWGLYDVHGNVWEWCLDSKRVYGREAWKDERPLERETRVLRGGCWGVDARQCRVTQRMELPQGQRNYFIGFRVVLVAPAK